MHGGSINAHSAGLGHGSEFVVRLPVGDGHDQAQATSPQAHVELQARRILLVDDSADTSSLMAILFRRQG